MSSKAIIGAKSAVEAMQADIDQLMGYPRRGTCSGDMPIPSTYSPGAFGWTAHHASPQKHPVTGELAIEIDADVTAALADPGRRKALPAAKAAALDAAAASATKLPADWTPTDPAAVAEEPRHA